MGFDTERERSAETASTCRRLDALGVNWTRVLGFDTERERSAETVSTCRRLDAFGVNRTRGLGFDTERSGVPKPCLPPSPRRLRRRRRWLGDRDSNPDSTVQSRMSYRWTISQRTRVNG